MRIYLVRHAQSHNNARSADERIEDPSLTGLGRKQAVLLAQVLRPAHLFTSPFRRALETTSYLHQKAGVAPRIWVDLHEQGGCVSGTDLLTYRGQPGMTRAEISREFPGYYTPGQIDQHGWWKCRPYETMPEARGRATRVAQKVLTWDTDSGEHVVFVSHGTFIQLLLEAFRPLALEFVAPPMAILNASITCLEIRPGRVRFLRLNSVHHLPEVWVT